MNVGETFYLPDFAGGHINFVLEVLADGSVITCNFTDYTNHSDKTFVIEAGVHSVITKKSVVNFRRAEHCECGVPLDALLRLIGGKYREPLGPEILGKIRQAALDSPFTSDKIRDALKVQK